MPVVIEVIPDRFSAVQGNLSARNGQALRGDTSTNHVRRPTRGIVLKDDTFATLRVVAGNNQPLPIIDGGSRRVGADNQPLQIGDKRATDVYSNFLLQSVQEERAEKSQILETFGEPYIFLYGERARILTLSGVLANTFDFNWEAEWWENYENYLRGTRCVENDARVFLSFDETLVGGYILGAAATKTSEDRNIVHFQFQMFVTLYTNFSRIGSPYAYPNGEANGAVTVNLSREQEEFFRPAPVPPSFPPTGNLSLMNGEIQLPTLSESLMNNLQLIRSAWQNAQETTNVVLNQLADFAGGSVVRIPVGFEGALEFDVDNEVRLQEVSSSGTIRYTVFSDNDDEYVGSSDHYGSSATDAGVVRYNFGLEDELMRGQQVVDKAVEQWRQNGYFMPGSRVASVSSHILSGAVGLLPAGSTRSWVVGQQAQAQGGIETLRRVRSSVPSFPISG